MKIIFDPEIVGPWVCVRGGGTWVPGRGTAIGLQKDDGTLQAGVIYEDYNKANVVCHISAEGNWATNRKFLWMIFDYPFMQLKVKRITLVIAESRPDVISFAESLGFTKEAELKDAHPDGSLMVYKMVKDQCRWLELKGQTHEALA